MDWVHCNSCYCQPGKPDNRKFVITNCGHIYCNKCNDGSMSNCYVCNRECLSILIESGMSEEMEPYFLEHEKVAKIIKKHTDVLEFQHSHRMKFFEFLNDKLEKYKEKKKEVASLKDEIKRHRADKNNLKDEIMRKNDEIKSKNDEIRKLKLTLTQYEGQNKQPQYLMESGRRNNENFLGSKSTPRTFGSQLQNTLSFASVQRPSQQFTFKPTTGMGSSPNSDKDQHLFTPPPPVSFQNAYRNCDSLSVTNTNVRSASVITSPISSENLHRRVLLPGDKGFSPNRIGLQRLMLKTPSSVNSMRAAPSPVPKLGSNAIRTTPSQSYNKYKQFL